MMLLINKSSVYKFIRFAMVGVFNTILDLLILNLLISLFSVTDPFIFSICKGISFIFALINSYFMNKYFTFGKKQTSRKDFYLFILLSLIGLIVNVLVSGILFYLFGLYPSIVPIHLVATISGIIGAIFTMFINYFNYSYFIFK